MRISRDALARESVCVNSILIPYAGNKPPKKADKHREIDPAERTFFEGLQELLERQDQKSPKARFQSICGVDAAYSGDENRVVAVASLYSGRGGELIEESSYAGRATFPYVSGLFFLREGPFVNRAVERLSTKPDLICFDAHGISHPRHKGLATVCGMLLGTPSIGIAKSLLVGRIEKHTTELAKIKHEGKTVGYVTFSPKRYWSPGYSISIANLESIIQMYGNVCLDSISSSDQRAKKIVKHGAI